MVGVLLWLAGCTGRGEQAKARAYVSPSETLSLPELIAALNERNAQIESLYLQGSAKAGGGGFEASLRESRDQPARFVNGEITALYLAPNRLRLVGTKDLAGQVFDLGSNGERFWMHLPTENQFYTGTFAGLHPEAASALPMRPDLVLEVLGAASMDTDLLAGPAPMLRYNPDADAYMLTWAEQKPGPPPRWTVVKEAWYDRKTLLPTLVILFDDNGDPVLRAYLSRHRAIGGAEDGPQMASYYDIYFPVTGSSMWLDFGAMHFRNPQNPLFPGERSFGAPDPGGADVWNLDEPLPQRSGDGS